MEKRNGKSFALFAMISLVILEMLWGILLAYDMQASAARAMDVAFSGHGAWPEHHHFDVSAELRRGEDSSQTLYAKVKNSRDVTVFVQVGFFIAPLHCRIYTEMVSLSPGNILELTADFGPLTSDDAGIYYVTATCLYRFSLEIGDWIASDTKEFKFAVVS